MHRPFAIAVAALIGSTMIGGCPLRAQPVTTLPAGDSAEVRKRLQDWNAPPPPAATDPAELGAPVSLRHLSSLFGIRHDPLTGLPRRHQGIDIPAPIGTPVRAAGDGVVVGARWAGGYGQLVEIEHGPGLETRYGHLARMDVVAGSIVRRGDIIGLMGSTGRSTGSHLHFEVRVEGRAADPLQEIGMDLVTGAPLPPLVAVPHWHGIVATTADHLPLSVLD